MMRQDIDTALERGRMAIAEAGFDPLTLRIHGGVIHFDRRRLPPLVAWRARDLVGWGEPVCFRCYEAGPIASLRCCDATARGQLDCEATS